MTKIKSGTERYGRFYWGIKSNLSKSGDIYAMADDVIIAPDGTLLLVQYGESEARRVNLAFAPGQWTACFAASMIDGHAGAVEHWAGEIVRE